MKEENGLPPAAHQRPRHALIPTAELTDEEMIELDNQAKALVLKANELRDAGSGQEAVVCMDQAIAKMQQVADEMNRRRRWIFKKIEEMRSRTAEHGDPKNDDTPNHDAMPDQ